MRLFNTPLGLHIGSRFGKVPQQICLTGNDNSGLTTQLDGIQTQLDLINQKLQSEPGSKTEDALFQTTTPTKVALYYFNQTQDQKLVPEQQINIDSILPVYRMFPASKNLLLDTINELIRGNLTAAERQQ
jgi:hypothetical protein